MSPSKWTPPVTGRTFCAPSCSSSAAVTGSMPRAETAKYVCIMVNEWYSAGTGDCHPARGAGFQTCSWVECTDGHHRRATHFAHQPDAVARTTRLAGYETCPTARALSPPPARLSPVNGVTAARRRVSHQVGSASIGTAAAVATGAP